MNLLISKKRFQVIDMAKRNNDHLPISDILKEFVDQNNLQSGLDKVDVRDAWAKMMGNGVNNYTTNVQLDRETLYVQLSSSVLREELSYGKEKIIKMLNESLGKELNSTSCPGRLDKKKILESLKEKRKAIF